MTLSFFSSESNHGIFAWIWMMIGKTIRLWKDNWDYYVGE